MNKREQTRLRFMDIWPKTQKNLTDIANETHLHRATLYKFINNLGSMRDSTIARIAHWVVENEKQVYFSSLTVEKIVNKYTENNRTEGDFYEWAKIVYERIQMRLQEKK